MRGLKHGVQRAMRRSRPWVIISTIHSKIKRAIDARAFFRSFTSPPTILSDTSPAGLTCTHHASTGDRV